MFVFDMEKIYTNRQNKDDCLLYLYREAYKIFKDIYYISHFSEITLENEHNKGLNIDNDEYEFEYGYYSFKNLCLDATKAGLGIEITQKALLLENGVIVHIIPSKPKHSKYIELSSKQLNNPVTVKEYLEYGLQLDKLKRKSLEFHIVANEKYCKCINVENHNFISSFRHFRNTIHFPYDMVQGESINYSDLRDYINKYVVEYKHY